MRSTLAVLVSLTIMSSAQAAGRPMTIDDLLAIKTVSDPQISPDGKLVAYVVSEIDRDANKSNSDIWLVPIAGGAPKKLTSSPGADAHPRWSPDGKTIAFTSTRSGSSQIWLLPTDGGEAKQLTKLPTDVEGPIWSPNGDKLAFSAQVIPGKTVDETAKIEKAKSEAKSKARIFDSLMIRHWTSWDEGLRSHLFVCDAKTGEAKDLIPDWKVNVPPGPFGGSEQYAWSPDGKEIAFASEPLKDGAWSTNKDIWTIAMDGGKPANRTESNQGADEQPSYSPDGALLGWVSQARAGFEADQWIFTIQDRKSGVITTFPKLGDRPIQSFGWATAPDKAAKGEWSVYAVIDDKGSEPIANFNFRKTADGSYHEDGPFGIVRGGQGVDTSLNVAKVGERPALAFITGDSNSPGEVGSLDSKTTFLQLTRHNDELIKKLDVSKAEAFKFKGAGGDEVSGWLIKPPGFDASKKYPVLFLIHGGPQGAWHDEWHARWNYQLFAAPGYAVIAINPRGSTGYGQSFTDQISKDWNGKVYEDLMKGLDHALATYSFLDKDKVAAAGGSYGGYMVNWILGHSDRFKCLISHAGVFDLTSKYGTTEELWFPDWEFGGPPWKNEEVAKRYLDQSPSRYVGNFKTPTLITHGALDFRVPEAQGLGLFTGLQRQGIASRFVLFPDEGHWVLKPANRLVWWTEMHAWLAKYLK